MSYLRDLPARVRAVKDIPRKYKAYTKVQARAKVRFLKAKSRAANLRDRKIATAEEEYRRRVLEAESKFRVTSSAAFKKIRRMDA